MALKALMMSRYNMSRYMTERLFAFALSSQETLQLAQLSFRNAISAKGFLRIFQKHIILYEPIQPFIYDINKDHKLSADTRYRPKLFSTLAAASQRK
jgi:hypothetical protein